MIRLIQEKKLWIVLIALIILAAIWVIDWLGTRNFDIQNLTVLALVFITFMYTVSTERIANETAKQREWSEKQLEALKEQQTNAVAPVVTLDAHGRSSITVDFTNIGSGPALNFRCWIEDQQYPQLKQRYKAISERALGVSNELIGCSRIIITDIDRYRLGQGYIRAQYEDVFGRTYESALLFSENVEPELKYGPATEKTMF